jgi:hypothetical protein
MPWIKAVKNILDSCGFSNTWENQGNFNSKWLSLSLKQKLFDQFQQKWRSHMLHVLFCLSMPCHRPISIGNL